MGLFDKAKKAAQQAQQALAPQAGQQGDGMVHVHGAGGMINPAAMGGPSTSAVASDDPIWQPINGISLQDYAEIAREAQARGVTDEAGMIAIAQERGLKRRRRSTVGCSGWASRWPSDSSSASSSATDGTDHQL
jgi:hypothetical protein